MKKLISVLAVIGLIASAFSQGVSLRSTNGVGKSVTLYGANMLPNGASLNIGLNNTLLSASGGFVVGHDNIIGNSASAGPIIGGTGNYANGDRASIIGSSYSTNSSDYSSAIIGGRFLNISAVENAQIIGGLYSRWTGGDDGAMIGTAYSENQDGEFGGLIFGIANTNSPLTATFIAGGSTNRTYGNTVNSFINGGANNILKNSTNSFIVGGQGHRATNANNGFIIGGSSNVLAAPNSGIIGGTGVSNGIANAIMLGSSAQQIVTLGPLIVSNAAIQTIFGLKLGVTDAGTKPIITSGGNSTVLSFNEDTFEWIFDGTLTGNGSGLTGLNASQLTSGTVPTARLGSGIASSGTFLRGDQTWAAIVSLFGTNATSGGITNFGTATTLTINTNLTVNGTIATNTMKGEGLSVLSKGATGLLQYTNNTDPAVLADYWTLSGSAGPLITALTASRSVFTDSAKRLVSGVAAGAVPQNADGSATTFAQVNALAPGNIVTNGYTLPLSLTGAVTIATSVAGQIMTVSNGVIGTVVAITNLGPTKLTGAVDAGSTITAVGAITSGNQFISTISAGNIGLKIQNGVGSSIAFNGVASLVAGASSSGRFIIQNDTTTAVALLQIVPDQATVPLATLLSGSGVGTDKAGGELLIKGGGSTGTGRGGAIRMQTSLAATSTGSAANSFVERVYIAPKRVNLTAATATLVFNLSLAAGKHVGFHVFATTHADDGTDVNATTDEFLATAVNKSGTVTTATSTIGTQTTATSSTGVSTMTTAWTVVANGSGLDVKCNATSTLIETTLATRWRVEIDTDDSTLVVTPQ